VLSYEPNPSLASDETLAKIEKKCSEYGWV
jgi:hypothetical protein